MYVNEDEHEKNPIAYLSKLLLHSTKFKYNKIW